MSKERENKVFTSIVKRKEYNITVDVKDVGKISRHVIIFENKTDKEVDVYVELTGKYSFYYLKAVTLKEDEPIDLPNAVYATLRFEAVVCPDSLNRLCFKRWIA